MTLTLRRKLVLAFGTLAIVGGSGGLLSLFGLSEVVNVYRQEQSEIEWHEDIHEDRITLLSLRQVLLQPESGGHTSIKESQSDLVASLVRSNERCMSCHSASAEHVAYARELSSLIKVIPHSVGKDSTTTSPLHADVLRDAQCSIDSLEGRRHVMEELFHDLLASRRHAGMQIVQPIFPHQLILVCGGVVASLLLAWYISRIMIHPILPLIASARNLGDHVENTPLAIPADPDLAQVARALNEMTELVATRSREGARKQLLERTIATQEDERKRLSRELHDTLGQSLSAVLLKLRSIRSKTDPQRTIVEFDGLESGMLAILDDIRSMAWQLRPSLLDDLGLQAALGRYVEDLSTQAKLKIDYENVGFSKQYPKLPPPVKIALYRVAQEALTNVVRHAHACSVSVVLIREPSSVTLLVEDDGVGFVQPTGTVNLSSLGLLGMEERIHLVGGELTVTTSPGHGTSIRAKVPLVETLP